MSTYVYAASCVKTAGEKQAALYANECMTVSAATHPPCNADFFSCEDLKATIKTYCEPEYSNSPYDNPSSPSIFTVPIFCKFYTKNAVFDKFTMSSSPVSYVCFHAKNESDLSSCINDQVTKSNDELNKLYDKVMDRAKQDDAGPLLVADKNYHVIESKLKSSQSAWLNFRSHECDFISENNTTYQTFPIPKADCIVRLNNERLKQLQSYRDCSIDRTSQAEDSIISSECPFRAPL